jgi:hypothetical protein
VLCPAVDHGISASVERRNFTRITQEFYKNQFNFIEKTQETKKKLSSIPKEVSKGKFFEDETVICNYLQMRNGVAP